MQIKQLPQDQNEAKKLVNEIIRDHLLNLDLKVELDCELFNTSDLMETDIEQFMVSYAASTAQRLIEHLNDLENQNAL